MKNLPVTGGNVTEAPLAPRTRITLRLAYLTGIAAVSAIALANLLDIPAHTAANLGFATLLLGGINILLLPRAMTN